MTKIWKEIMFFCERVARADSNCCGQEMDFKHNGVQDSLYFECQACGKRILLSPPSSKSPQKTTHVDALINYEHYWKHKKTGYVYRRFDMKLTDTTSLTAGRRMVMYQNYIGEMLTCDIAEFEEKFEIEPNQETAEAHFKTTRIHPASAD